MADGTINIDLELGNEPQFISDIKHIGQLFSDVGDGAGNKLDSSMSDNLEKVNNKAAETSNKIRTEFGKETTAKANVKADTDDASDKMSRVERNKRKVKEPVTTQFKGNSSDFNNKTHQAEREKAKLKKPISVRIKADLQNFSSNIRSAKDKLGELREQGQKVKGIFSGSFLGSLAGNAVSSGIGLLVNGIKAAGGAAIDYDKQLQTLQATWSTLTGSATEGKKMVDMTLQMATAANNSVDMVQDLNTKIYAVTGNAEDTKKQTNAMLTLQDAFGKSDDAVKGFATQWSQMQGNGKVSAQDMMSFINVFAPMRKELLSTMRTQTGQHDMTMAQMNDMMSAGKISSDTMDQVLFKMQKQYANASTTFAQTLDGLGRTVKSRVPALLGELTAPFLDKTLNPIMQGLAGWIGSSDTDKLFKGLSGRLSKSVDNMFTDIKNAFNMHGSLNDMLNQATVSAVNGLITAMDWFGKHASDLKTSGDSIWNIAKAVGSGLWKGVSGSIKAIASAFNILTGHKSDGDGMHSVADALQSIASHKDALETIGKMWGIYWVASKFFGIASGITGIGKSINGVYQSAKLLMGLGDKNGKTSGIFDDVGKLASKVKNKISPKTSTTSSAETAVDSAEMTKTGLSLGGKLVVGLNIALAGFDIVKGIMEKNKTAKFKDIGSGIGTIIGTGIGIALAPVTGGLSLLIAPLIGAIGGKAGGAAAKKAVDGWNDYTSGHKPKGIIAKIGFNVHEAMTNWNNILAGFEKKHPILSIPIKIATAGIKTKFDLEKILGNTTRIGAKGLSDIIHDVIMGRFGKLKSDLLSDAAEVWKNLSKGFTSVWDDITGKSSKLKKEDDPKKSSNKKTTKKATTKKDVEEVTTTHVSKTDVKNVKAMIPVIKEYKDALSGLKSFLKDHDPTKEMSSMNSRLKNATKGWNNISAPIKKIGNAFKTLSSFTKSMGKNDAFAELNTDLPKLDATLKNQKIGANLKSIGNSIKDSKIASRLKSLTET
ncbi:hypothetical protein BSQ39_08180 [Loigolactobacillus backii]|uniref:tape measure protein n=1 Tax=Loigolactobacillus backii TaxID=375175 RepID=UPI000C1C851C|nr:tape measure protein [Loigolactobacillus backii]PIO83543.1 hypothetical protein BSQ39_08180 [Loigolactobacillus backii]